MLDTQLLLRMSGLPGRLSNRARTLMVDPDNTILFSAINIWEVSIKRALGHPDFMTEPAFLRSHLLAQALVELPLTSDHAIAVRALPPIHKDPFDRVLIAQATAEQLTLLTTDMTIARYPGDIILV